MYDTIVIGAGQAGLAAGYHLQKAGLRFIILEASSQAAGSWPRYYESLELFSPARYSSLPGLPFPGNPERYPLRNEVIAYLKGYASHFSFPIITNSQVITVNKIANGFEVHTANGQQYSAQTLISATGAFANPYWPQLVGEERFQGQILHSAAYQNPAPFKGQRVMVVGAGNSAIQIATELAEVADVTIASRQPIKFLPQRILGKDVHFWIKIVGFDSLPIGQWLTIKETAPVLDKGKYQAALAAKQPKRRAMFIRLTTDGVMWTEGEASKVETVILATGYRPNQGFLADLGALHSDGQPQQKGGVSQTVAGLYYVGLPWQRAHASATLRGVGADAKVVVRHIGRYCRSK